MDETQESMLLYSANKLLRELKFNTSASHVKMYGTSYHNIATDEEFEVQVIVTRKEKDFMVCRPFEVEVFKTLNKEK